MCEGFPLYDVRRDAAYVHASISVTMDLCGQKCDWAKRLVNPHGLARFMDGRPTWA